MSALNYYPQKPPLFCQGMFEISLPHPQTIIIYGKHVALKETVLLWIITKTLYSVWSHVLYANLTTSQSAAFHSPFSPSLYPPLPNIFLPSVLCYFFPLYLISIHPMSFLCPFYYFPLCHVSLSFLLCVLYLSFFHYHFLSYFLQTPYLISHYPIPHFSSSHLLSPTSRPYFLYLFLYHPFIFNRVSQLKVELSFCLPLHSVQTEYVSELLDQSG